VHGTGVVRWTRPPAEGAVPPEADAAVTDAPGVVLAILTADCLPVVFAARDGSEIGAAHAGWRGLAAGVLEATVAALATPPDRLQAWLGPAAGPDRYEIGAEVREAFVSRDPGADAAFTATRPGHWRVDLYALARRRLAAAGVMAVHGGGRCTLGEPACFFSHRRDGRSGRLATLAWLG
jgi:YfiH family protein